MENRERRRGEGEEREKKKGREEGREEREREDREREEREKKWSWNHCYQKALLCQEDCIVSRSPLFPRPFLPPPLSWVLAHDFWCVWLLLPSLTSCDAANTNSRRLSMMSPPSFGGGRSQLSSMSDNAAWKTTQMAPLVSSPSLHVHDVVRGRLGRSRGQIVCLKQSHVGSSARTSGLGSLGLVRRREHHWLVWAEWRTA